MKEEQELKLKLQACSSLKEMLAILDQRYDLSKPLGFATKPFIIAGLIKAYQLIKPIRKL